MDGFSTEWLFYIAGGLLMLAEFVLPGGIVGLLGLNAVITGLLVQFGLLQSVPATLLTWFGLSLGSYLIARPTLTKLMGGESTYRLPNEQLLEMDQIVDVVEPISFDNVHGRIRFQGISWQATCLEGQIPKGKKARIKYRDNLTYVVEPTEDDINP